MNDLAGVSLLVLNFLKENRTYFPQALKHFENESISLICQLDNDIRSRPQRLHDIVTEYKRLKRKRNERKRLLKNNNMERKSKKTIQKLMKLLDDYEILSEMNGRDILKTTETEESNSIKESEDTFKDLFINSSFPQLLSETINSHMPKHTSTLENLTEAKTLQPELVDDIYKEIQKKDKAATFETFFEQIGASRDGFSNENDVHGNKLSNSNDFKEFIKKFINSDIISDRKNLHSILEDTIKKISNPSELLSILLLTKANSSNSDIESTVNQIKQSLIEYSKHFTKDQLFETNVSSKQQTVSFNQISEHTNPIPKNITSVPNNINSMPYSPIANNNNPIANNSNPITNNSNPITNNSNKIAKNNSNPMIEVTKQQGKGKNDKIEEFKKSVKLNQKRKNKKNFKKRTRKTDKLDNDNNNETKVNMMYADDKDDLIASIVKKKQKTNNKSKGKLLENIGENNSNNLLQLLEESVSQLLICFHCKNSISTRVQGIQCDDCKKWYHLKCMNLIQKSKGPYSCKKCIINANTNNLKNEHVQQLEEFEIVDIDVSSDDDDNDAINTDHKDKNIANHSMNPLRKRKKINKPQTIEKEQLDDIETLLGVIHQ